MQLKVLGHKCWVAIAIDFWTLTIACMLAQRDPGERVELGEDYPEIYSDSTPGGGEELLEEACYLDAEDYQEFEGAPLNNVVNLDEMAENYFARVDEIHQNHAGEEDGVLDFDDLSSEEDEPDRTPL